MLFRLTSVKELSLFFTLWSVSSTLVGLGGSSNTGFIFSPLTTSGDDPKSEVTILTFWGHFKEKEKNFAVLTVISLFTSSSIICLITGDQCVDTQNGCAKKEKNNFNTGAK